MTQLDRTAVDTMKLQLVVFDVDGTLTCHPSIWWRLHQQFGTETQGRLYFQKFFSGEISYKQWADLDAGLWAGRRVEDVMNVVRTTRLVTGARETVDALKAHGIETAILSGGIDLMANYVAKRLGIDYVLTNRLLHREGLLTGEVDVSVGWGDKASEIRQIADHFGVSLGETCYVGDGRNDISAFSAVGLSISFRPESEEVARAAKVKIQGDDLRLILPHILGHT
ncbi:MAG: HAD family phosphatase [Candidatus Thorarchaeota archaeon]